MGAITRAAANNFTTGGVILPAAINDASVASLTELENTATGGAMTLISEQTASASASISFTTGIDSTYPAYKFEFINCHPATNAATLGFQADTGTNTSYNQTMTTTVFRANQDEGDGGAAMSYRAGADQAQGTSFQQISQGVRNDNDTSVSGEVIIFNPSSSTFVKHFFGQSNTAIDAGSQVTYYAGYFNTTTALTRVQFKMSSGNIDSGTIKMYGISGS